MTIKYSEPTWWGIVESRAALTTGQVSATRLVGNALDRIDATQSTLNAFRRVRRYAAINEAIEADRQIAEGHQLPLLGVPIAIKDDTDLTGEPTAFGCGGDLPLKTDDSEAVRRLRDAGAIIVGKTNTPELCEWSFTHGAAFGHTRNPWHHDHTPGGSSGGSAAAVAGGLVPAALGSDSGGSIRVPAAWSNLVAIKPQRGRIPSRPYTNDWHGLTVHGPLARTVADAAVLLDVISGHRVENARTTVSFTEAVDVDPGPLKIALSLRIPFTLFRAELDPEVRCAVEHVAQTLRREGHAVIYEDPDYDPRLILNWAARSSNGISVMLHELPATTEVETGTRTNARFGRINGPAARWARNSGEPALTRRVGQIFDHFDVVLAPTTAAPPPRVDAIDNARLWAAYRAGITSCPYTFVWNVLGWPAITIPAGFTADGLPIGAQLLGGANSEPLLISLAAQLESDLQWYRHHPSTSMT